MRLAAVALILVGGLLFVPAATAAPTWLAPSDLGTGTSAPVVATGATGDTVVAWTRNSRVEARLRAPGGGFGDVQALGGTGGTLPAVAVAGDGTALAAWAEGTTVLYSVRPAGGGFGAPQALPEVSGLTDAVTDVRAAASDRGDFVIAYARSRAAAAYIPAGGALQGPSAVSGAKPCGLQAAIAESGHAAVAWQVCNGAVQVARRPPDATFGPADTLPTGTAPAVAVDRDGTTVVAWEAGGAVRAASAAAGAGFGTPVRISAENEVASAPTLAAGGADVVAAYRVAAGNIMATRRAGGGFPAAIAISPDGTTGTPALGGSSAGAFVATWLRDVSGDVRVEAARAAPGAAFTALDAASDAGADASSAALATDSAGNAVVAFLRGGPVLARALDAAGPLIAGVDVRPAGFAEQTYPFAFQPVDAWSSVASSSFDFGDGTTAPGPQANHAYSQPGERTVTMSAVDTLGNANSASRTFGVAPPLDLTPPTLTQVKMDAKRFRVTGRETPVAAAVRAGTRFRYTLSEPAQATIFFERVRSGRRRGRTCVRGRSTGRKCKTYEAVGLLTRRHPLAGRVSVGFSGRLVARNGPLIAGDVRLRPGRYRATIVAADANKNVSKRVRRKFTVVS